MHIIPEEKNAAVTRALGEAFGVTGVEDIRKLSTGPYANLVCRIVVGGERFLLRIITRPSSIGAAREFACMNAAAAAGLAPRVRYTRVEDSVSITDYVEAKPLPQADAVVSMARVLRDVHALPAFPAGAAHLDTTCMFLMHEGAARDTIFQKCQATNVLSEQEWKDLMACHARLAAAYSRSETDFASSHNDLFKPDNILFDGQRVWLVDWEASFLNDRYVDLAVVANLVVSNDAEEEVYLTEYFGRPPDSRERARLFLMRQLAHMFYAMAYLMLGASGKPVDRSGEPPEFEDFQRRLWAREVDLTDSDTKIVYGRVHWERLVRNMQGPRFEEALRIVS